VDFQNLEGAEFVFPGDGWDSVADGFVVELCLVLAHEEEGGTGETDEFVGIGALDELQLVDEDEGALVELGFLQGLRVNHHLGVLLNDQLLQLGEHDRSEKQEAVDHFRSDLVVHEDEVLQALMNDLNLTSCNQQFVNLHQTIFQVDLPEFEDF
jgi:hypothetical protein